ncbi:hypothetical protein ACUXZZ_44845 [Streptomyces graminifolii]|uniref:hypothetical protein n=1 Tax=Streptomyces graminifolii TaxID=1266771 RepID=UPI0040589274
MRLRPDFRPTEQLLQSHADLWLTPLTGVRPETYGGVWPDVLDQAERVVRERLEQEGDADEDSPLQSVGTMLWFACRAAHEGDLIQAGVSLGYCETLAQSLEARPEDGLAPQ